MAPQGIITPDRLSLFLLLHLFLLLLIIIICVIIISSNSNITIIIITISLSSLPSSARLPPLPPHHHHNHHLLLHTITIFLFFLCSSFLFLITNFIIRSPYSYSCPFFSSYSSTPSASDHPILVLVYLLLVLPFLLLVAINPCHLFLLCLTA